MSQQQAIISKGINWAVIWVYLVLVAIGFLAIWYYWAKNLRQASVDQDTMETEGLKYHHKQRKWAASFLPIGGFLSTVFLWQSIMSVDPHWYSTMFAWYSMVSMWLGAISLTVILIIYLKSLGYLEYVTFNHLHDIGKFLFGISVFWTYLWFDQFMLIWYANNGEETIYFNERMTFYPVLFWGNLLLNFVTPFLILMRNDTKRKFGTMFFVAIIVFFGHWWDYFYMIKPGARTAAVEAKELAEGKHHSAKKDEATIAGTGHDAKSDEHATAAKTTEMEVKETATTHDAAGHADQHETAVAHDTPAAAMDTSKEAETALAEPTPTKAEHQEAKHAAEDHAHDVSKSFKLGYTIPGLDDIGVLIGFLSLFLFFFFNQLTKASLMPMKDPYLDESLHHDTGTNIEGEGGESHH